MSSLFEKIEVTANVLGWLCLATMFLMALGITLSTLWEAWRRRRDWRRDVDTLARWEAEMDHPSVYDREAE